MLIKDLPIGAKFVFDRTLYVISDQMHWQGHRKIYRFDGLEAYFDERNECKHVWPEMNVLSSSPERRPVEGSDMGQLVNLSWMVSQFGILVNVFTGETKAVTEEEVTFYPEAFARVTL